MSNRRRARRLRAVRRDRRRGFAEHAIRDHWFPRPLMRWKPFPPEAAAAHRAHVQMLIKATDDIYGPPRSPAPPALAGMNMGELLYWIFEGSSLLLDQIPDQPQSGS